MWQRRQFLRSLCVFSVPLWRPALALETSDVLIERTIVSTGQRIPVIGMGSWLTFDCANDPHALRIRVEVLRQFFAHGGAVIDSSPMYGSSEQALGYCLSELEDPKLFSATKVWTYGRGFGERQMAKSARLWGLESFDLMQVHNLLDVEKHLETLTAWKESGRVGYIGATTSHGRRHDDLLSLMERGVLDFVQFTYNMMDREAEQRLLPMASERGIAVIVNRPFRRSRVFDRVRGTVLPNWAAEFDCKNWAQFFLKFVVSHPAVACAIPATSRVDHMVENMGALRGRLPDPAMRRRMAAYFDQL
ncbi:MAG: diketogulonate reductase-like aldo/keto reductase [Gammaproteobacteria bacterium]|jgi:diketogulonate reductase-like aldo/keto reductase